MTTIEVSKNKILFNSGVNILAHVVNMGIMVWLQPFLINRISTSEYSLYPVIMSVMVFIFMVRTILTGGIARSITEAYVRKDERSMVQITSTMFLIQIMTGCAVLLLGLPLSWAVHRVLTVQTQFIWDARLMMGLMMVSFVVQLVFTPFTVGFFVKQKFGVLNSIRIAVSFVRILVLFILLFGVSTRVIWVVVATETAELFGLIIRIMKSRALVPQLRFSRKEIEWARAKDLLAFGFWNFILQIATQMQINAAMLVLNKMSSAFEVTRFHLGTFFSRQTDSALLVLTQPVVPALTAVRAQGDTGRLSRAYLKFGRYYTWLFLLVAVPFMIYSRELMALYVGQKYLGAAPVLCFIFGSFVFSLGNSMMIKLAIAIGRIRRITLRVLLLQIVNIGLTIYLVGVHKLGALGPAISIFAVQLLGAPFLLVPIGLRIAGVTLRQWLVRTVVPGYMPSIGGLVIWLCLRFIKPPDSWLTLVLYFAAGAVGYLSVLSLFAAREGDRQDLKSVFLRLFGRRSAAKRPADAAKTPKGE